VRFLDAVGAEGEGRGLDRVTAGPLRLSALVRSARLSEAQRALHAAFVAAAG
jgi:hypothetical protein